jgi:hypothetical protein
MKTLFWKAYYKHKLGKEGYEKAIQSAHNTIQSTNARISHFYNEQGETIRGWAKKNYNFSNVVQHPLITKYQ